MAANARPTGIAAPPAALSTDQAEDPLRTKRREQASPRFACKLACKPVDAEAPVEGRNHFAREHLGHDRGGPRPRRHIYVGAIANAESACTAAASKPAEAGAGSVRAETTGPEQRRYDRGERRQDNRIDVRAVAVAIERLQGRGKLSVRWMPFEK